MNYPKYVSHKEVGAVKIESVEHGADGSVIVHLEGGFDNVVISHHDKKHKPVPEKGMYLVQYADGYISFSPAKAFEDGYTPIGEELTNDVAEYRKQIGEAHGDDLGAAEGLQRTASDPSPGSTASSVTLDSDDDDEEDEEVLDAANNHGQDAPAPAETVTS